MTTDPTAVTCNRCIAATEQPKPERTSIVSYTYSKAAIPVVTVTREPRDNPHTAFVAELAADRTTAGSFMLTYDPKDPATATIDPGINKELARVMRDLNAAGRSAGVTIRKRAELITEGKTTKGVQVTAWAVDQQKRERKPKTDNDAPAETPTA